MTRILTAIVGIVLVVAVTGWGPEWLLTGIVALVGALALDEFLGMVSKRELRCPGRWWLAPGAAVTLSFSMGPVWIVWSLVACLLGLSIVSIAGGLAREHLEYFSFGIAGLVYACLLPGFLLLMESPLLWVLLTTVWAGDIAAYYCGRLLGRHRLAPVVSPNKTVEGAIAGGVASVLAGGFVGSLFLEMSLPVLLTICLLTGIAGQLGDLAESALKRTAGVKDSGDRLPGHGGVLDRIDSLLFAGPVFQFFMTWAR